MLQFVKHPGFGRGEIMKYFMCLLLIVFLYIAGSAAAIAANTQLGSDIY
jgi:hypothetical protein